MLFTILIVLCITHIEALGAFLCWKWWQRRTLMEQYCSHFDEMMNRRWEPPKPEKTQETGVMPFSDGFMLSLLLAQEIGIRSRQYRDPDLDEDTGPQRAIYIEELKRSTQTLR